jgi:hypothetical protein
MHASPILRDEGESKRMFLYVEEMLQNRNDHLDSVLD